MGHQSTTTTTNTSMAIWTDLAPICTAGMFQVRDKLCQGTVKRYASAIKAGQDLPPLQVAMVNNVPCLVDGYHRLAAMESLGMTKGEVVITEATKDEALWMAASANLSHGLPLKPKEVREVFRVYMRTGRYKKGSGKWASYREIGQALGKPHTTIHNWMKKDFRKIFNAYGEPERSCSTGGCHPIHEPSPPAQAVKTINLIHEVLREYQETTCAEAREAIVHAMKTVLFDHFDYFTLHYMTP